MGRHDKAPVTVSHPQSLGRAQRIVSIDEHNIAQTPRQLQQECGFSVRGLITLRRLQNAISRDAAAPPTYPSYPQPKRLLTVHGVGYKLVL